MSRTNTPSGNEDTTMRCKRCGFPAVDTQRDKTGSGSGLIYVAVTHTATSCPDNPTVIAGCPFCGCKAYKTWQK